MRASQLSSDLEQALAAYAQAAARLLQEDILAGAEVELELGASRPGHAHTPFYSCRPLTERFLAQRHPALERLPEHPPALAALARFDGLSRYLAGHSRHDPPAPAPSAPGAPAGARQALGLLLEDVFAEQTHFELRPERLAAALARLERAELRSAPDTVTLLGTLHGLAIGSPEIQLTRGLTIATPSTLRWAPAAALAPLGAEDSPGQGPTHLLIALTCRDAAQGRAILRDLLRALRLFGDGRVTLGALAWARAGGQDAWSTVPLGAGGRPQGMLIVTPEQEDELRAFCNLVSRRAPHGDEIAWALRRFELGCERPHPYEGLSDHLLALRVLLEPEGPTSGLLAGRLAALCATPDRRVALTERILKAQKLERAVIAGAAAELADLRSVAALEIARDVADHLRALLRDVICGHLSPDLITLADTLLAQAPDSPPERPADHDPAASAREVPSAQQVLGHARQTREVVDVLA